VWAHTRTRTHAHINPRAHTHTHTHARTHARRARIGTRSRKRARTCACKGSASSREAHTSAVPSGRASTDTAHPPASATRALRTDAPPPTEPSAGVGQTAAAVALSPPKLIAAPTSPKPSPVAHGAQAVGPRTPPRSDGAGPALSSSERLIRALGPLRCVAGRSGRCLLAAAQFRGAHQLSAHATVACARPWRERFLCSAAAAGRRRATARRGVRAPAVVRSRWSRLVRTAIARPALSIHEPCLFVESIFARCTLAVLAWLFQARLCQRLNARLLRLLGALHASRRRQLPALPYVAQPLWRPRQWCSPPPPPPPPPPPCAALPSDRQRC
jgi:hypothetical protein